MLMTIFNSVFKTTLTSAMMFVSIIRLGMIAYPTTPDVQYSVAPASPATQIQPAVKSQVIAPGAKRRIVLGQNSIENLGRSK